MSEQGGEHFPDLIPTGDPEQDLTQLVTLLEHLEAELGPGLPKRPALVAWQDVLTFAKHLRGAWDDDLETGDGRQ